MLKFVLVSLFIMNVVLVLTYDGTVEGGEVNAVFRGKVIDTPLGVDESSLADAVVYDAALRSFLSAYGVLSIEKLIPGFEPADTLGVTRTGEIVRLTDYSRFFILKFRDDSHADAFLADAAKARWIWAAEKPQRISLCALSEAAESIRVPASPNTNDPLWPQQWNLHGGSFSNVWGIRIPEAWNLIAGLSRRSVYIGIIDTGIPHVPAYSDHEDLTGRVDGDLYWDWSSCEGYDNTLGALEHGLGVAGIIGALANNGVAIAGIDPLCRMHVESDRMNGSGQCINDGNDQIAEIARGIVNSTQLGVEILNMSISWEYSDYFAQSAIADAYRMNILSVASAGNENSPAPTWPSSSVQGVVSVGASDNYGRRVAPPNFNWGSNYGPYLDIMAPGDGDHPYYTLSYRDGTMPFGGTSGSAPHVTGVASLLLSIRPNLYNDDLEGIMESSARDRGDPGRDDYYGWGILDAEQALKRVLLPYSIEHCSASGNGVAHDLGAQTMEFCGVPGLEYGIYPSRMIKVTKHIQYDKLYARTPSVWGRGVPTRGYSPATRNFGLGYTRVFNVGPDGFDLETYTYHVYNLAGQDCGWHPCEPEGVTWHYTINGIEDVRSPSVTIFSAPCGYSFVTDEIVYIYWRVDDEYLEGVRCTVALNLNGGEGEWTVLASDLPVDGSGEAVYTYRVPSGPNETHPRCLMRVSAYDTNNHEGLCNSCEFSMEYQPRSGGGGSGDKEPIPVDPASRMSGTPVRSYLAAAYPNPFNPSTRICFGLAEPSEMKLVIYDSSGRLVRRLIEGRREAGYSEIIWDGRNEMGGLVPSGIYFCQLRSGSFVATQKMVLLK